jgi:hypothetical protein
MKNEKGACCSLLLDNRRCPTNLVWWQSRDAKGCPMDALRKALSSPQSTAFPSRLQLCRGVLGGGYLSRYFARGTMPVMIQSHVTLTNYCN